jgi:hypothetical protein
MRKSFFYATVFALLFFITHAPDNFGQSEVPRFEVGGQFSTIKLQRPNTHFFGSVDKQSVGGGGRFIFNAHKYLAIEAEVNFFADDEQVLQLGSKTMAVFGVKSGKRWEKFGIFGKFRPGFTRFSEELRDCAAPNLAACSFKKPTEFTMDVGGVAEYYPSSKFVLRFDAGDTIIRYKQRNSLDSDFGVTILVPYNGSSTHNFQFSAGVGIRF